MNDLTERRKPIVLLAIVGGAILLASLLWTVFAKTDVSVEGEGVVTTQLAHTQVFAEHGGTVARVCRRAGEPVSAGDVLIEFSSVSVYSERQAAEELIRRANEQLALHEELLVAIGKDVNTFSEKNERLFYDLYKSYEQELASAKAEISARNVEIEAKRAEAQTTAAAAERAMNAAAALEREYDRMENAVEAEKSFYGKNDELNAAFTAYENRLALRQAESRAAKLESERLGESDTATKAERDAAAARLEAAELAVRVETDDFLALIASERAVQQRIVLEKSAESDAARALLTSLSRDNSLSTVTAGIKSAHISASQAETSRIEQELISLNAQLNRLENTLSMVTITAPASGVVTYDRELVSGDVIAEGELVGAVVPERNVITVMLAIEDERYSGIKLGQSVEYIIEDAGLSEYGVATGIVTKLPEAPAQDEDGRTVWWVTTAMDDETAEWLYERVTVGMRARGRIICEPLTVWQRLFPSRAVSPSDAAVSGGDGDTDEPDIPEIRPTEPEDDSPEIIVVIPEKPEDYQQPDE